MLGAIVGDIVGSIYEFKNFKSKEFAPFFHPESRYTDDTICTVAIADSLLNKEPPDDTLRKWGRNYWNKGRWGQKYARWLSSSTKAVPYNSFGNGSAMRVSPCSWLSSNHEDALEMARSVTVVTHNHPEGIKGALATASAIFMSRQGKSKTEIYQFIERQYEYDLHRTIDQIRAHNPHSEACQNTVPESIMCALQADNFEDAIRNAISIGGDSDTIAAITGSIAESLYGIPELIKKQALAYLPDEMKNIYYQFNSSIVKIL